MALPEYNPKTGHSIGCTCEQCAKYFDSQALKRALRGD